MIKRAFHNIPINFGSSSKIKDSKSEILRYTRKSGQTETARFRWLRIGPLDPEEIGLPTNVLSSKLQYSTFRTTVEFGSMAAAWQFRYIVLDSSLRGKTGASENTRRPGGHEVLNGITTEIQHRRTPDLGQSDHIEDFLRGFAKEI